MSAVIEQGAQTQTGSLLFVDDEPNILSSLRRLFRPLGYTVFTAHSGAEGLEILETESVDLVVSDMRMPEMDGARLLAEVAERWPQVVRFLLTGYADMQSTITAINKGHIYGYFSKPWEDNEIKLAVRHALEAKRLEEERQRLEALTRRQNEELKELNATLEQKVAARTEELRQSNLFLELAYAQLEEAYYAAIPIFANLIELREGPKGGHGKRVGLLAREIALRMGSDEATVRDVYFAGLLHDVGKIAYPDELLQLPVARATEKQRKIIEKHPTTGQAILMGLGRLENTALYIRQHHERYDGKGYPDHLAGEAIAQGARIVKLANDYDGLRAGKLLGRTLTVPDAREFIVSRSGTAYDPEVVEAFVAVLEARAEGHGEVRERHLSTVELRPGMLLSRDLLSNDGILLLTKGYQLTEILIDRIQAFENESEGRFIVYVCAEEQGG